MKSSTKRAEGLISRMKEKKSRMFSNKRGMSITDLWPAFTMIAGLFVLVIVLLVIFGSDGLGGFFTAGTAEANATTDARDRFISILPMLGIVLLIVVLSVVIGVVVNSLWFGGGSRRV